MPGFLPSIARRTAASFGRAAALVLLPLCALVTAQEPAGEPPSAEEAAPSVAEPAPPAPAVDVPPTVEEVRPEIFYLKDDAGELVPVPGFSYRDFIDMMRLKDGLPRGPKPPAAVIASVVLDGRIEETQCFATVELKVAQSEDGWVSVPLALEGLRLTEPPTHVGPGRCIVDASRRGESGGYEAWFDGKAGGQHTVLLHGALAVERSASQEAVAFDLPRAAASRVRLVTTLARPVATVEPQRLPADVSPESPDEDGDDGQRGPPSRSVVSVTGIAGRTRIRLRDKDATTPESLAAPQSVGEVIVRIDGRRAMSDVTLRLSGLSGETGTVAVRLPPRGTVAAVRPPSSLVETRGSVDRPEAVFAVERSREGEATLRFECETPVGAAGASALEVLAYGVEGIPDWRQWGRVSLMVNGDWQVSWGPVPANRRVDPPPAVDRQTCVGAFAYDAQPARLPLQVKPLGSRVVVEPEYGYSVGGTRIELDVRLRVSVRGAPVGQVELGLDGWGIDSVGPSSLVDGSTLSGESGRLVIPFVKPLTGNATLELRAARVIARSDATVEWKLPAPKADVVGPASVTIVSDSDIELLPDAEKIRGLVRQVAPSTAVRGAEASALAYRLEGGEGVFAASRRFLARKVDASVAARAAVDRAEIVVDEAIRLDVAYVPLESVSLAVPRRILDSGSFEVRLGEQRLSVREDPLPTAADDDVDGDEGIDEPPPLADVRAELPSPRLGTVDLRVRYAVKTPEVPAETTVPEDLPLVMPREGRVARQSFAVETQEGIAVDLRGEQWKRDVSMSSPAAPRSWTAAKPQEAVPIALSAERQTASTLTSVEAAWLVTRLLPGRREDSYRYRIATTAPNVVVTLPGSTLLPAEGSVEVRLDGRSVPGELQPGGRVVVGLSGASADGECLLEIERMQPRPAPWQPLVLEAPQFGERTVQRRFYWELRLHPDDHVVVQPANWTSQQQWQWTASGFERRPLVSRESLEEWLGAGETAGATETRPLPALAERRAVFAGVGWPGRESAWIAPTWLCVLVVSGAVLAVGLALVYRPTTRVTPVVLSVAGAVVALAAVAPDQVPLAVQSAVPGLVLTAIAALIRWAIAPRKERGEPRGDASVVITGSSTRAAAPSLVIGSTARADTGGIAGLLPLVIAAAAAAATAVPVAAAEPPTSLRFMRVHVPRERISPELLGSGRYVPMPLAEFDAAVEPSGTEPAGAGHLAKNGMPHGSPARSVSGAHYQLAWRPSEGLSGEVAFTIDDSFERFPLVVAIPGFLAADATVDSAAGTGVATVIGLVDGRMAVVVQRPGRYRCRLRPLRQPLEEAFVGSTRLSLPLVPALSTTIDLTLPAPLVPVAEAAPAVRLSGGDSRASRPERTFRLEAGPVESIRIDLEPSSSSVSLAVANDVVVERRQFRVTARIIPTSPWNDDGVAIEIDPGLAITAVSADEAGGGTPLFWTGEKGHATVRLSPSCHGRFTPVVIEAIAPFERRGAEMVPLVRVSEESWAGGRATVSLEEMTTFTAIEAENATIVDAPVRGEDAGVGTEEAAPTVAIEQQSSKGSVKISVADRPPEIDTARITTIDIAGGTVTARAAVNVRVRRGEVFELDGQIGAGWLIDSVEIPDDPGGFEWGGDPAAAGKKLRIGLVRGISPGRELSLRIVGHRAALPLGQAFPSSSLDMVRFDGEAQGQEFLDVRANAETTILVGGVSEPPRPTDELPTRLRGLAESGMPRARLPAGALAEEHEITVLRRRPPVDVQTQIRLTARDDRLAESYTFECAPRDSEIDSLVVLFSEPDDAVMEWSVLAPATAKATARRAEKAGALGAGRGPRAAEAWLVEIVPPVHGAITLRATRSVPFRSQRAVPLAWIEGAPAGYGEISIRDAGRVRPRVLSSTLPEVPNASAVAGTATPMASFTFDIARDLRAGGPPVLEIAPGEDDPSIARAWAWSETTTTRCHEAGVAEYETIFLVENRGRTSIMLQPPPDKRLEEIEVDGARVANPSAEATAAEVPIELPAGRSMVRIAVRMLAKPRGMLGVWSLDATTGRIDVPVLARSWQLAVPPSLTIASWSHRYRAIDAARPSILERLTGITSANRSEAYVVHRFSPVEGGAADGVVTLVHEQVVVRLAILAAMTGAMIGAVAGRWPGGRRAAGFVAAFLIAGLALLWAAPPWFAVARWGIVGLVAGAVRAVVGGWRVRGLQPAVAAALLLCAAMQQGGPRAAADEAKPPEQVFVTPGDAGGVALVPERLYRAIAARDSPTAGMPIGVVRSRLVVGDGSDAQDRPRCSLDAEVDGPAGGLFRLEQDPEGPRFVAGSALLDGAPVPDGVSADGRTLAVPLGSFGRHVVRVEIETAFVERGGVADVVVAIPPAAASVVQLPQAWLPDGEDPHECEWRTAGRSEAWRFAARIDDDASPAASFDVSGGRWVRLSRSTDPRVSLVRTAASVACDNLIAWDTDECRVAATIDANGSPSRGGDRLCRAVVLEVDPRLEPSPIGGDGDSAWTATSMGEGRLRVEWTQPRPGVQSASLSFRMPLDSPVGVFRVPTVAPVDVAAATVDVRLRTASDRLRVTAALPESASAKPPTAEDVVGRSVGWSSRGAAEPVFIGVTRRPTSPTGSQELSARFGGSAVRLHLRASLRSRGTAVSQFAVVLPAGCVVDAVRLLPSDASDDDPTATLDIRGFRKSATRFVVVPQRPRSGSLRLELDARLPGQPADRGDFPLLRLEELGNEPLSVSWSADRNTMLALGADDDAEAAASGSFEVTENRPAPRYRLVESAPRPGDVAVIDRRPLEQPKQPADEGAVAVAEDVKEVRVELVDIRLAVDARGRGWGVVRFDLLTDDPLARIRLPAGFRLLDALVDDHPLATKPVEAGVWEARLLDVSRPRSVVAVFAGDLGGRVGAGDAVDLPVPVIEGLPVRDVIWTVRGPRDRAIRFLPGVTECACDEQGGSRRSAMERLTPDVVRAFEGRTPDEQARIRAMLDRDRPVNDASAEAAWERSSRELAPDACVKSVGVASLRFRIARPLDPTLAVRVAGTLTLVAGCALAWHVARRGRAGS